MRLVAKASINPSWRSFVQGGKGPSCALCHWSSPDEVLGETMCGAHIYAGETSLVTGSPEKDQRVRCEMVRTDPICRYYAPRDEISSGVSNSIWFGVSSMKVMMAAIMATVAAIMAILGLF